MLQNQLKRRTRNDLESSRLVGCGCSVDHFRRLIVSAGWAGDYLEDSVMETVEVIVRIGGEHVGIRKSGSGFFLFRSDNPGLVFLDNAVAAHIRFYRIVADVAYALKTGPLAPC